MASPKRDQYKPGAGKLLKDDDSVLDVSALLAKIDSITSAVSGLLVNATITTGDIEIGAVELKNGTTDARATINAVNTARTTADIGLVTQEVDPAGTTTTNVTAGADAVSNTRTDKPTSARLSGFNGTTWDRLRTAVTTVSATLTGFLNTLPWAVYNATPTTRTEGQGGPLQGNSKGSLNTTATTKTSGEVQDIDAIRVEDQVNYTNISASALIYTGAGRLKGFVVNSCAAGATIKFWDNTSAATTVVLNTMTFTAAVAQGPVVVDLPGFFRTTVGLYCTIAVAAMDVTIAWRQTT